MARVVQNGRSGSRVPSGTSPFKQAQPPPVSIPLNDDASEKARSRHSRQALHEAQINQIRAAATPGRKIPLNDVEDSTPGSSSRPKTPRASMMAVVRARVNAAAAGAGDDDDAEDLVVAGTAVTPMKRVPILANFEEWMRMATDNKINATNSWNFALIDYFHDMSLLREGDGVNFQKASCTLDGCVKIYTSRVDSVASETGKLLSGLADSGSKKKKDGEGDDQAGADESGEDEVGEDGEVRRRAKKKSRSSEATLAPSFASLQLKKFELEFAVDPMFKKASADFDEGGAKGLLLNHLMIDAEGRIVFDSSDDAADASDKTTRGRRQTGGPADQGATPEPDEYEDDDDAEEVERGWEEREEGEERMKRSEGEITARVDTASLGARFFSDLSLLDELYVCPSLRNFELGDPSGSMDIPFLKAPEDWRQDQSDKDAAPQGDDGSAAMMDYEHPAGSDDEDLGPLEDMAEGVMVEFGGGGEAWAREAALEPQIRVYDRTLNDNGDGAGNGDGDGDGDGGDGATAGDYDEATGQYVTAMQAVRAGGDKSTVHYEHILGYFDQALQKSWATAEEWRVRKVKDTGTKAAAAPTRQRKEREPFEIDFGAPLPPAVADALQTQATSNAAISMPKKDWTSKTLNLLPDDKNFSSKQLLGLFTKPRARVDRRRGNGARNRHLKEQDGAEVHDRDMDEAFWAQQQKLLLQQREQELQGSPAIADEAAPSGDYNANFFQDDGLPMGGGGGDADDDEILVEFSDARDHFSPERDLGLAAETGVAGLAAVLSGGGGGAAAGAVGAGVGDVIAGILGGAFGSQLVTQSRRVRPEYVQYARVAKKVDVRQLKEKIWAEMGFDKLAQPNPSADPDAMDVDMDSGSNPMLKFTSVMNNLQSVYPRAVMDDISTSYCFICLLHLANEKGLAITKSEDLTELDIQRDWTAELTEG